MRELYNEFFHIPKDGKIREKVMLTRVAMTVVIMVMCLAAMSITAYAYFSYNVTSGSSIIKAANFEANVSIHITDPNYETVPVTTDNFTYTANLKAGKTYSVTLSYPSDNENAAKTGFCVITAEGCPDTYYTRQLGIDQSAEGGRTLSITFPLTVTKDTTLKILSHWGTSSFYASDIDSEGSNKFYIDEDNNGIEITVRDQKPNSPSGSNGKTPTSSAGESKTSSTAEVTQSKKTAPITTTVAPTTTTAAPTTTTAAPTTTTAAPTTTTAPPTTTTAAPTTNEIS